MLLLAVAGLALMIGRAPRAATPTTSRATTVSAKYLDEPLLVPGAVAANPEKMDCTPRAAAASALCVPRRPARPVPKLTSLASGRGRDVPVVSTHVDAHAGTR